MNRQFLNRAQRRVWTCIGRVGMAWCNFTGKHSRRLAGAAAPFIATVAILAATGCVSLPWTFQSPITRSEDRSTPTLESTIAAAVRSSESTRSQATPVSTPTPTLPLPMLGPPASTTVPTPPTPSLGPPAVTPAVSLPSATQPPTPVPTPTPPTQEPPPRPYLPGLGAPLSPFVPTPTIDPSARDDPSGVGLDQWVLGGSAVLWQGGSVVLTPSQNKQVGYVHHPQPMSFDDIIVRFAFEIGGGTGADGLGLLLVPAFPSEWVAGPTEASGWGSAMGSPLFDYGIGIYFDTHRNRWDISDNLISVSRLGHVDPEPVAQCHLNVPLSNAGTYLAEIHVGDDRIHVYLSSREQGLDRTLILSASYLWSVPRGGYLGFIGTTGGANDRHIIHDVVLTIDKSLGSQAAEPGTPNVCSSGNGSPPAGLQRPIHDSGIDLAISHIERLPRYPSYSVTYWSNTALCPYPFEEDLGPALCPSAAGIDKRWPDPGEEVEFVAHVHNLGARVSGRFAYRWKSEGTTLTEDTHPSLAPGEEVEIRLKLAWPRANKNPQLELEVELLSQEDEVTDLNNLVVDWIKGHAIGFSFDPIVYENLRTPGAPGPSVYSPEYWLHAHIVELNKLLADAGLEDRVRIDLILLSNDHDIQSKLPVRRYLDGWWAFRHDKPKFHGRDGSELQIDYGLIHELLHQLGVIDLYRIYVGLETIEVPDANHPGRLAGCGTDYWHREDICFFLPEGLNDIMGGGSESIGEHTAGGLASNFGHRRGYYGEYLFDTPATTALMVMDKDRQALQGVNVRFYQLEVGARGQLIDATPEFEVTTGTDGSVELPNRGIIGPATQTGHQLRPNPFGIIDVVGLNGLFLLEMVGECTNYAWLSIVDLNLAYWAGETASSVVSRTLVCPPP